MGSVVQWILSDEVLDKTMHVFWERGYFNTSIDDVVAVTGFNKAAIYKYFGGKHELFVAMLKRYRKEITPQFTAPLRESHLGLQAIKHFFQQFLTLNQSKMPCGCFLIATASELPMHDKEVRNFIQRFSRDLTQLFSACLNEADKIKKLKKSVNKKSAADFLVVNVFGLMTLHRAGITTQIIKNHITLLNQFLQSITVSS